MSQKILHSLIWSQVEAWFLQSHSGWNILETHFPRSNFHYKMEGGKLHPPNNNPATVILCTKHTISSHGKHEQFMVNCIVNIPWISYFPIYHIPSMNFPIFPKYTMNFPMHFLTISFPISFQLQPIELSTVSPQADEPAVVMHTAGGRRKRLGVGGRVRGSPVIRAIRCGSLLGAS